MQQANVRMDEGVNALLEALALRDLAVLLAMRDPTKRMASPDLMPRSNACASLRVSAARVSG
eukprot:CAMPEP_0198244198 /NCGR_PEP_ID=MMETSP1446-20131203/33616_1 /TAXON_ID=1461542 ORGANISM="Unidentified sp, Strain CCMP2111" /NCGR_SAMPLE_ID=MMETSP1446 /ASSEMBLY_ACC=CAM_ASM_001112 /LENGTH=61 /DNA_ID=CAMNT_0043928189 /DNA_START=65 /DNA_END=247 /DNA_ORIENTATION=-